MNYRTIKQISVLFFISVMLGPGYGVDARLQRWENRTEKLGKTMNIIEHGDYLPMVKEIITGGIESSRDMSSILNRYSRSDGSLKSETKKYSLAEIEAATGKLSSPVISLFYLLDITRNLNDPRTAAEVINWVSSYAAGKNLPAVKAGQPDTGELISGYIMEMSMGEYAPFADTCYRKILGKVEYELSRSDYNSNDIDIEKLIIETSVTECGLLFTDRKTVFIEKYLLNVPQWKIIVNRSGKTGARNLAAESFAVEKNIPAGEVRGKGIEFIAAKLFRTARAGLTVLIDNSTASVSSGGNNPMYEIPDMKTFLNALDEIDRYRDSFVRRMDGTEDKDFAVRVRNNNTGIAEKYISRYEAFFKREDARMANLKKNNGSIIIYNEEIFLASKKHFNDIKRELREYADLSSDFIERTAGAGKVDPDSFISDSDYLCARENEYMSFIDRLAGESSASGIHGNEKINNTMKQAVKDSILYIKNHLKPLTVPAEIRKNMTRENVRSVSSINESRKTRGLMYASSVRKYYDNFNLSYNSARGNVKKSELESESRIAQQEIDILFSFAKKCSDAVDSMDTTASFIKEYRDVYESACADINDKGTAGSFTTGTGDETLLVMVTKYRPEDVEKEVRSREILAAEGMDALSGAVALCQYYSRKGIKIEIVPSQKEISEMKKSLTSSPEIRVSSWTMTGKNFRQVDLNCTGMLKKMQNRKASTPGSNDRENKPVVLSGGGINLSFDAPGGWSVTNIACESGSAVKIENPDKRVRIEVYTIDGDVKYLQEFSRSWLEERGYTPVEKSWGKVKGEDCLRTISRDNFKNVCETRMFLKNGSVVIVCGVSEKNMARNMNGFIEKLFAGMNF